MKQAGIKMGIGTDLVVNWFRFMPDPYITELKQFVKAGYTIPEALVADCHDFVDKVAVEVDGHRDRKC